MSSIMKHHWTIFSFMISLSFSQLEKQYRLNTVYISFPGAHVYPFYFTGFISFSKQNQPRFILAAEALRDFLLEFLSLGISFIQSTVLSSPFSLMLCIRIAIDSLSPQAVCSGRMQCDTGFPAVNCRVLHLEFPSGCTQCGICRLEQRWP